MVVQWIVNYGITFKEEDKLSEIYQIIPNIKLHPGNVATLGECKFKFLVALRVVAAICIYSQAKQLWDQRLYGRSF